MDEMKIGPAREDIFYLKMAETMFKHHNIKAVYTSWGQSFTTLYEYYLSDLFLMPTPHFLMSYLGYYMLLKNNK